MQQPPYPPPRAERPPERPRRRHGRFGRFFRGYLMTVGAAANIMGLIWLLVRLFVEIGKWVE